MLKFIFTLLIDPLGLPIDLQYEDIVLTVIGIIAYHIAFNLVGDMYQISIIDSKSSGSFFHWTLIFFCFEGLWGLTRIALVIINNYVLLLMIIFVVLINKIYNLKHN